jgi:hypothetical protein
MAFECHRVTERLRVGLQARVRADFRYLALLGAHRADALKGNTSRVMHERAVTTESVVFGPSLAHLLSGGGPGRGQIALPSALRNSTVTALPCKYSVK